MSRLSRFLTIPTKQINKIHKKNRKRFKEILSDKRFNNLERIFVAFEEGQEVPDEVVNAAYHGFSSRIHTNTISSAELEFVIVATIAAYKPNLAEELLTQPLLMLVRSFGDEIDSETVASFVNGHILHKVAEPYGGIPGEMLLTGSRIISVPIKI